MKTTKIITCVLIGFSLIMVIGCSKKKAEGIQTNPDLNPQNRILVVYSTNLEQNWSKQIEVGTRHFLKNKEFIVEVISMNIFPGTSRQQREEAGRMAMEKFNSFKPGIILAIDDPAQSYFASQLSGRNDVNLVFCGVEADITPYRYPNFNVTGILMRPQIKMAIDLLSQLAPEVNSYTVLTDTSSQSDMLVHYLKGLDLPLDISILQIADFAGWQDAVINLSSDAVILLGYEHIADAEGPGELLSWTVENLKIPSLAFKETAVQHGILLGVVKSGYEHGSVASIYTNWITGGKRPSQIPITLDKEGISLLNLATAARLGLDVTAFEADTVID